MARPKPPLTTFLLPTRSLLHAARILLLGPVTLAGCASEPVQKQERPVIERTDGQPTLSALFEDLREEGPASRARDLRAGDLSAERLVETDPTHPTTTASLSSRVDTDPIEFARRMIRIVGGRVFDVARSPDRANMAFIVSRKKNKKVGEIWICPTDGEFPYVLHPGLNRARLPVWRPDGSPEGRIFFISRGREWSLRPVLLDSEETES